MRRDTTHEIGASWVWVVVILALVLIGGFFLVSYLTYSQVKTNLSTARVAANDAKIKTDLEALSTAVAVLQVNEQAALSTSGLDNVRVLTELAVSKNVLASEPVHPTEGKVYHYRSNNTDEDPEIEYVLFGELSTGECYIIANSESRSGNCQSDTSL